MSKKRDRQITIARNSKLYGPMNFWPSKFTKRFRLDLRAVWEDEHGAILSTELILVAVIGVVGLVVGLGSIRDSVVSELADVSGSVQELNQSYSYSGVCYVRDADGNITVTFDHAPTNEGEFVPCEAPDEPTIEHVVGDVGTLSYDNVVLGQGGSYSGSLTAPDGSTTGFTSTTDTGEFRSESNGNMGFRESPAGDGTFTTTFDDPIADLELFVAGTYGGPDQNILGNFTVTLSDGTVLNNAAFTILPDAISPNSPVGAFTSTGLDQELLQAVNVGGADYVQDPTNNGVGTQAAGRIVFTDVPPPGDDCIGIVSVAFDRRGGPPNFTAWYSFSGRVIEIQP